MLIFIRKIGGAPSKLYVSVPTKFVRLFKLKKGEVVEVKLRKIIKNNDKVTYSEDIPFLAKVISHKNHTIVIIPQDVAKIFNLTKGDNVEVKIKLIERVLS